MDHESVEYTSRYLKGCHMSSQSVGPETIHGLTHMRERCISDCTQISKSSQKVSWISARDVMVEPSKTGQGSNGCSLESNRCFLSNWGLNQI